MTQVLTEETWREDDILDPNDKGIGLLRSLMKDVKPSEIEKQSIQWLFTKSCALYVAIMEDEFSPDFIRNEEYSSLIVRYLEKIDSSLSKNGIPIRNGRVTAEAWMVYGDLIQKKYRSMNNKNSD